MDSKKKWTTSGCARLGVMVVSASTILADMAEEAIDHVASSMPNSSSKRIKLVQPQDGMYINGTGKYQTQLENLRKEGEECSLPEASENVQIATCIFPSRATH